MSSKELEELFLELLALGTKDHLMGCAWEGANPEAKAKGIVLWHAYSLLEVVEETRDDGTPQRLMQVRNPWGHKEWKGDWGDDSELWSQNPQLHERMKTKMAGGNDGKFFMSLEDWGKSFNALTVCPIGERTLETGGTTHDLSEELEDEASAGAPRLFLDSDDESEGPKEWINW
ncbi:unnamed protein product [Durusdinium trenchii]|uniref:Calpain catalytic domain-containing protein n=1 Tax=Durusdinium trenchii TaxID=1381693 RepID=A0ABP0I2S7_9DINO